MNKPTDSIPAKDGSDSGLYISRKWADRLNRAAMPVAAVVALGGAAAVVVPTHIDAHRSNVAAAKYEGALRHELGQTFVGPVAVVEASDSGLRERSAIGGTKAIISVVIGGAALNEAVVDAQGTPPYIVEDEPLVYKMGPDGNKEPVPASWVSAPERGDIALRVPMGGFDESRPVTKHYEFSLAASGWLKNDHEIDGQLGAIYDAGEVDITGSNGNITGVTFGESVGSNPTIVKQGFNGVLTFGRE